MDDLKTLATLVHEMKTNTIQRTKKMSNTEPTKNKGVISTLYLICKC